MANTISRISFEGLSTLLIIGAIAAGTAYAGSVVKKNDLIEAQTAEEFAILDAGAETDDISELRTKLEFDHGQYKYHIKFIIDDTEYVYGIRAKDGSVLSKEIENKAAEQNKNIQHSADQIDQQTVTNTDTPDPQHEQSPSGAANKPLTDTRAAQGQPDNHISVDQAKKTALDHAGLSENEVKFSSAKLDNDDGNYEYEIEFYKDQLEYEYEIDAVTGEIIYYEIEND